MATSYCYDNNSNTNNNHGNKSWASRGDPSKDRGCRPGRWGDCSLPRWRSRAYLTTSGRGTVTPAPWYPHRSTWTKQLAFRFRTESDLINAPLGLYSIIVRIEGVNVFTKNWRVPSYVRFKTGVPFFGQNVSALGGGFFNRGAIQYQPLYRWNTIFVVL